MPKFLTAVSLAVLLLLMNACVSSKQLYYFHDKLPGKDTLDTVMQVSSQKIQKNDRLIITVSSTDPALTAYLNPFNVQNSGSTTQQANNGYLVNPNGKIEFPLLGQVEVAGLSTVEAAGVIREKLSFYYKDLFVNVNLRGQVYFMNGRVGTPIPMINERLTIFEAIAQSGIQDAYDKKNAVWLVREKNGERLYTQLDLNSKDIFQSPYYYLQNNDLLYMQPRKISSFFNTNSPARNIISIAAAVAALLIAIRNI